MSTPAALTVTLLSDTTFGAGGAGLGEVDVDIERDDLGLPVMGGKALHGLLRDAWLAMAGAFPHLDRAAVRVLGRPGDLHEAGVLRVGDARVDAAVRAWVAHALERSGATVTPADVLAALTGVRARTAEDRATGGPARGTLRTARVALRTLTLHAPLTWLDAPADDDRSCLALCALATRHAGLGSNRGAGHVQVSLDGDPDLTRTLATGATR